MNTFLGIDNVHKSQIILACKELRSTGEIRQLWREKLRTRGGVVRAYFDQILQDHWPLTVATTWVDRDPAGVLANYLQRGGHLIRYHQWELARTDDVPAGFTVADALAMQAIHDEQVPLITQFLRKKLVKLQHKLDGLTGQAAWIAERLVFLENLRPELDEIPF